MPMGNHNTKIKQLYRAILPCAPDINKFWELVWFVDQYWYTGFSRSSDTTDDLKSWWGSGAQIVNPPTSEGASTNNSNLDVHRFLLPILAPLTSHALSSSLITRKQLARRQYIDITMGESRQELVAWLNNLLQLNITKVEQCGTGAALCQVFDSIFYDVPMSRVKFNANTEYAYLQNFKVLQNTFAKHQIDKPIRVESLVKCKMQDNLEFLQFVKQYWDQHFPGHDYDPVARRKGQGGVATGAAPAPRASTTAARRAPAASNTAAPRTRTPLATGGGAASAALREENTQLKETVTGLERERDFYFSKLRDIELLIQQAMEADPELEKDEGLLKQIQNILYSTEEGFEIPPETEGAEEETF
ncbi:hypothetical protein P3342_003856 [Pyrenophora teres f. teres]|nr:hypothetical protein P3342_003856 [Pyrenophora teres f. teres]